MESGILQSLNSKLHREHEAMDGVQATATVSAIQGLQVTLMTRQLTPKGVVRLAEMAFTTLAQSLQSNSKNVKVTRTFSHYVSVRLVDSLAADDLLEVPHMSNL